MGFSIGSREKFLPGRYVCVVEPHRISGVVILQHLVGGWYIIVFRFTLRCRDPFQQHIPNQSYLAHTNVEW